MTFEIIKPKPMKKVNLIDETLVKSKLIEGLINDSVTDIHSAVEYTGVENGSQVRGMLLSLKKELELLSSTADQMLRDGKTATEIITALNSMSDNFDANDIKTYKLEIYGTLTNWKKSITSEMY